MTSARALDEFFAGFESSRPLFDALAEAVDSLGGAELRVSASQVAFRDGAAFAWAWIPDRYLGRGHAPLVLSVSLPRHDDSPRWKEIVEPAPGRFVHHLELRRAEEIDAEVLAWLEEARGSAGGEGSTR